MEIDSQALNRAQTQRRSLRDELELCLEPLAKVVANLCSLNDIAKITFPASSGLMEGYTRFLSNLPKITSGQPDLVYSLLSAIMSAITDQNDGAKNFDKLCRAESFGKMFEILKNLSPATSPVPQ